MIRFEGARLKIDRAEKHLVDLEAALLALPNAYRSSIQRDANTGAQSVIHEPTEAVATIRNDLALITGDCVHHLRTALDHAWTIVVTRIDPGRVGHWSKFPLQRTLKELEDTLKGLEIDTSNPVLFKFLTSTVKAYETGNDDLWSLHRLDITDKHRLLLPLLPTAWITNIAVKNQAGDIVKGSTLMTTGPGPYQVGIFPG